MTKIGTVFEKDIHRDINGVIKIGQLTEDAVHQELEEYVITKELDRYFNQFYSHYVASIDKPTDKIGVWISGFFGSGKSHFLKILSYLLENKMADEKPALSFFEEKIKDPMVLAAMARATQVPSDVISFNIDSKADASSKADKEAIVKVFLKVFNDHLGYFGSDPAIADFERKLDAQGKYDAFKSAFEKHQGSSWQNEREAWTFVYDNTILALQESLALSQAAAEKLVESIEKGFHFSVDDFARTLADYLDAKGPQHRLVFMVDEVGQYIGENSDLMLNLQTVSEDLGTRCKGRAWVVVTSQEDIDSVTQGKVKSYDFSKIQGRYRNRISLSSANTDEVIRLRLLKKNDEAKESLAALFDKHAAMLKHQIRFSSDTTEMPSFRSKEEFVLTYPFVPYQFKLLQEVFTKVREMGSSGKHLASGERSMLEAFQLAAQQLSSDTLGQLATFSAFYNAIEGFLDSAVTRVIENAQTNDALEAFDTEILKTLFMIRYVKEMPGSVENLITLNLASIDADRLALKEAIELSVKRLERQTLIQRRGDEYVFLTNEEQDIGRELKSSQYDPDGSSVIDELQKIIWTELYANKEYKFDKRHSYKFNRKFDDSPYLRQDGDIDVNIVMSSNMGGLDLSQDQNAMARTGGNNEVLLRLSEDASIFSEASDYVRTNSYISRKNSPSLSQNIKAILQARQDDNQNRKKRLKQMLEKEILQADVFVKGIKLENRASSSAEVIEKALENLIQNSYSKLSFVRSAYETDAEIERIFRDGSSLQTLEGDPPNQLAQADMSNYLSEQERFNQRCTLRTLIERYSSAPYGWTERDSVGVLAELIALGKAELKHPNGLIDVRQANLVKDMLSRAGLDSYSIRVPSVVNPPDLKLARELAKDYFGMASIPHEPQKLFELYQDRLSSRINRTNELISEASRGNYPFAQELQAQLSLLKTLKASDSLAGFFSKLNEKQEAFEDSTETFQSISNFFDKQRPLFDDARRQLNSIKTNERYLDKPDLKNTYQQAQAIVNASDPSRDLPKLKPLLNPLSSYLETRKENAKQEALNDWQNNMQSLTELAKPLDEQKSQAILSKLASVKTQIEAANSIDAAFASKSHIQDLSQSTKTQLLAAINESSDKNPNSRSVVTLSLSKLAPKHTLSNQADLNELLDELKNKLSEQLAAGHDIHID